MRDVMGTRHSDFELKFEILHIGWGFKRGNNLNALKGQNIIARGSAPGI